LRPQNCPRLMRLLCTTLYHFPSNGIRSKKGSS
jgi:hypothetical protein